MQSWRVLFENTTGSCERNIYVGSCLWEPNPISTRALAVGTVDLKTTEVSSTCTADNGQDPNMNLEATPRQGQPHQVYQQQKGSQSGSQVLKEPQEVQADISSSEEQASPKMGR